MAKKENIKPFMYNGKLIGGLALPQDPHEIYGEAGRKTIDEMMAKYKGEDS